MADGIFSFFRDKKKGRTYEVADAYARAAIENLNALNIEFVSSLPTTDISTRTIYFVPASTAATENYYDEYINTDGTTSGWELIGSTQVDLSQYYTKTETDTLLSSKADTTSLAAVATSGDYTDLQNTPSIPSDADDIAYDNTTSGASASNTQDALDYLYINKMNKTNPTGTGSFSLNRKDNTTVGGNSTAEGTQGEASGNSSHAEGYGVEASGARAHAEGYTTTASGDNAHAEGYITTASATGAHSEGYETLAQGAASHAEGNNTEATANYSHAEGNYAKAYGFASHAEGNGWASGTESHAEGSGTASGMDSHAEGSATEASGAQSHAEGIGTEASGRYSHAEGWSTVAASEAQHVSGKFNIEDNLDTYAEIIGNGTDNNNRANARTLDWAGNETIAGDIHFNGGAQSLSQQLADKADASSLATVATSGDYADLSNTPTIPAAQVNSDWNASGDVSEILNKPTFKTINSASILGSGNITTPDTKPSGLTNVVPSSAAAVPTGGTWTKLEKINLPAGHLCLVTVHAQYENNTTGYRSVGIGGEGGTATIPLGAHYQLTLPPPNGAASNLVLTVFFTPEAGVDYYIITRHTMGSNKNCTYRYRFVSLN